MLNDKYLNEELEKAMDSINTIANVERKKIYISGKITGIEEHAGKLFENAEEYLQLLGYETVNPMKLPHNHDKSWHSYMREDIKAMCECDEIFMLENWYHSKGAKLEHDIAVELGIEIKYQSAFYV